MAYDFDFRVFLPYGSSFLRGVGVTLALAVISSVVGTVLGMAWGIVLRAGGKTLTIPNDAVRAVPLLLLMLLLKYVPYRDLGLPVVSEFWVAVTAMTIVQASYTADVVRAAIEAVPRPLVLAARALGLERVTIWRRVILPDVVRQIAPAMVAFYIGN